MPDLMERAMAWLARMQRRHFAVPVVYERRPRDRGRTRSIPCLAVLGRPGATGEESVAAIRIDADELDFLIAAAELALRGRRFAPRTDDRIVLTRNGARCVYEVLPRGDGPPWRWSDPQKTIRRIHGKLSEETVDVAGKRAGRVPQA